MAAAGGRRARTVCAWRGRLLRSLVPCGTRRAHPAPRDRRLVPPGLGWSAHRRACPRHRHRVGLHRHHHCFGSHASPGGSLGYQCRGLQEKMCLQKREETCFPKQKKTFLRKREKEKKVKKTAFTTASSPTRLTSPTRSARRWRAMCLTTNRRQRSSCPMTIRCDSTVPSPSWGCDDCDRKAVSVSKSTHFTPRLSAVCWSLWAMKR